MDLYIIGRLRILTYGMFWIDFVIINLRSYKRRKKRFYIVINRDLKKKQPFIIIPDHNKERINSFLFLYELIII